MSEMKNEIGPLTLLMIEDSENDAVLELRELRRGGFDPKHERIETEAALKEALSKKQWDAIICDYSMPHFSAQGALAVLKESRIDIPFIVVSGTVGEDVAVDIMKAGANDYVMKDNLKRLNVALAREIREARYRKERRLADQKTRIAEQTAMKALKEAIEVRDEFISIASHELRTPLTSLFLQLKILERTVGSSDIGIALKSATQLNNLIGKMLDVSRMGQDQLTLEKADHDIVKIIDEVVLVTHEEAKKLGSSINFRSGRSIVGHWDKMRITQAITNLISNAIKYGDGKAIDIFVDESKSLVKLKVQDHGIGIDTKDQDRIFNRFERAVSRNISGLGLGLYVTKQIVEAHNGKITVESKLGRGSIFVVELPLR